MLQLRRSNLILVLVVLAFVIASLHLLSSPAHDGSFPEAVKSGWNDWKWPVYGDKDNDGGRWSDSDRGTGSDPATPLESNTSSATEASNVPTAVAADGSKKVPDKTVPGKEGKEAATPAKAGTKTNKETPTCVAQAAWKSQPLSALNTTFEVADDIFYDPAGPRPEQIVILTASDGGGHNGGIENIVERAMENRKAYCEYQGYINHFINISKFDLDGAHPVWKKLPAIVETFNKFPDAQWVWMLDLDAIVMTPTVDLRETLLSEKGMQRGLDLGADLHRANWKSLGLWTPSEVDFQNTDFLIAQDHNGVNAGSFFIRRSKFTQLFVDMWADPFFRKMTWPGQEQDTILHFVKHHNVFRKHLGIMKQRVANAFAEGGPDMAWREGDLLVHLAGCWVDHMCVERWEKFWATKAEVPAGTRASNKQAQ